MEPHNVLWTEILKTMGAAFIYVSVATLGAYKAIIYLIDSQIKSNITLIDSRASLKIKEENKSLEKINDQLEQRVEELERNQKETNRKFQEYNEQKIRELETMLKSYK